MSSEPGLCPLCGAALPVAARFCPQCGGRLGDGAARSQDAPQANTRRCVICGKSISSEDETFRCALCAREHLCLSHLVNGRTWAAGSRKVTIPACCEICYGEEYARNRELIEGLKKERSCSLCGLADSEFRCRACGRHFCARHALERLITVPGPGDVHTHVMLSCPKCGHICVHCASGTGKPRSGSRKCNKCGSSVHEEPAEKLREVLACCVSKGYLTGHAPRGYDEKGLPR